MNEKLQKIIDTTGRQFLLDASRYATGNKSELIAIFHSGYSCWIDDLSKEDVYSVKEILDQINLHDENIRKKDEVYKPLRDVFEPLVRNTEWFKKSNGNMWHYLGFYDGKYLHSDTVQAMFDIFCAVYKVEDYEAGNNQS